MGSCAALVLRRVALKSFIFNQGGCMNEFSDEWKKVFQEGYEHGEQINYEIGYETGYETGYEEAIEDRIRNLRESEVGRLTKEERDVIEVKNKLTGGISIDDHDPTQCPWCKNEPVYEQQTEAEDAFIERARCDSCSKKWTVTYTKSHYQEDV
jgi:hypothetical protein